MSAPTVEQIAEVLLEHRAGSQRDLPWTCSCGAMGSGDHRTHQADMLAAAGLLVTADRCCDATRRIDGRWLVEQHDHHTCGAGGIEGHEPGCGLVPLVDLTTLDGWDSLVEYTHAECSAEHDAQVLRDAAGAYQVGGWADDMPAGSSRPALILGMAQRASDWLRARADRITPA